MSTAICANHNALVKNFKELSTFWDSEDFIAWSQTACRVFWGRGYKSSEELTYFYLVLQSKVYFSMCTEERGITIDTLYFANQPLPSFWLKSSCRNEFPMACFTSPSGYLTGISAQYAQDWTPSCLPQGCLLILLIPLFLLPISLTSQSPLLETSEWPLILPGVSSHLTYCQVPQTLLSQYLAHLPFPICSQSCHSGSVLISTLLIFTVEVFS